MFGGIIPHMVGNKGLEPLRLSALEPKSSASANSANSPDIATIVVADHTRLYYTRNGMLKPRLPIQPRTWVNSCRKLLYGGEGELRYLDPRFNRPLLCL